MISINATARQNIWICIGSSINGLTDPRNPAIPMGTHATRIKINRDFCEPNLNRNGRNIEIIIKKIPIPPLKKSKRFYKSQIGLIWL